MKAWERVQLGIRKSRRLKEEDKDRINCQWRHRLRCMFKDINKERDIGCTASLEQSTQGKQTQRYIRDDSRIRVSASDA